jgi:hypothetical protein
MPASGLRIALGMELQRGEDRLRALLAELVANRNLLASFAGTFNLSWWMPKAARFQ